MLFKNKHYKDDFKNIFRSWRDGPVVKSVNCSYRRLRFRSQYPHGDSQQSNWILLSMGSSTQGAHKLN